MRDDRYDHDHPRHRELMLTPEQCPQCATDTRRQISLDHSPEPDRYDALRAARHCPLCHNRKDAALLVCWDCYRSHNIRDGMEPATAAIIDATADALNEAERKQWIDQTADALVAHCIADLMAEQPISGAYELLRSDALAAEPAAVQLRSFEQAASHPRRRPRTCPHVCRRCEAKAQQHEQPARTWTEGERAQTARILSHQLAEMLSTYGSRTTLEALQLAFEADMVPAADAIGAQSLARLYTATARALLALADSIEPHELNPTTR